MSEKIKVYMGVPTMGDRSDVQFYTLRAMEERYKDTIEFVYPECHVRRMFHDFARNAIVRDFLESDCDILFFLDADVVPVVDVMDIVLDHKDKWQAAAAPYPLWLKGHEDRPKVHMAVWNLDENKEFKLAPAPQKGIGFVDCAATGCLFLKRELLEEMEEPYFEFIYDEKSREMIQGEDIRFGRRVSSMGHKFFVDFGKPCRHFKTIDLLDVNNYAIDMSNTRLLEYDAEIRQIVSALEEEIRALRAQPVQKQSNLILPGR